MIMQKKLFLVEDKSVDDNSHVTGVGHKVVVFETALAELFDYQFIIFKTSQPIVHNITLKKFFKELSYGGYRHHFYLIFVGVEAFGAVFRDENAVETEFVGFCDAGLHPIDGSYFA